MQRSIVILALCVFSVCSASPRDNVVEYIVARDFTTKTTGLPASGTDWVINTNGFIETSNVIVPNSADTASSTGYTMVIGAYGSSAGGVWPSLSVYFDNLTTPIKTMFVNTTARQSVSIPLPSNTVAGRHKVRLQFTNDAQVGSSDRNLYISDLSIQLNQIPTTVGTHGAFPLQSMTLGTGFFPSNVQEFGTTTPCAAWLTGCLNIRFAKNVGATDVTLITVCTIQPNVNWCQPQINYNDEETALRVAIRYARSLGMTVTLKPFVLSPDGQVLAGYTTSTGAKWLPSITSEFFDSIKANLMHQAQIARQEGVSFLVIGGEFGGRFTAPDAVTGNLGYAQKWTEVISAVKAAALNEPHPLAGGPTLAYSYAPTLAGFWNDIDANEAPYVSFWSQLDYIGADVYPHMNLIPTIPATAKLISDMMVYRRMFDLTNALQDASGNWSNPSATDDFTVSATSSYNGAPLNFAVPNSSFSDFAIMGASNRYTAIYNTTQYSNKWYFDFVVDTINARLTAAGFPSKKAILTEIGAPSNSNVQGFWGSSDAGLSDDALYQSQQAKAWDGYLRAYWGDKRVYGISVFGLLPQHDASYGSVPGWSWNYDMNGKPAAETICKWFKASYVSGTCVGP